MQDACATNRHAPAYGHMRYSKCTLRINEKESAVNILISSARFY